MNKLESSTTNGGSVEQKSIENVFATETEPKASQDDAERAVAAEMEEFRTGAGIEERKARFKAVDSGCNNLVFISSAVSDPCQFAFDILSDIHKSGKGRARYMQRIFPVVATCKADLESVKKTASLVLPKYFGPPSNKSYLILYKARNSASALSRDVIIETVGSVIKAINPECSANLSDPDYAVSVDIIKTVCCISVFRDFSKLKKYNVHVEEQQTSDHSRVQNSVQPIKEEGITVFKSDVTDGASEAVSAESLPVDTVPILITTEMG